MHSFIISFVRTVLRVLSKYSPGLLIWPDVDEGDLMDEEFDSESDIKSSSLTSTLDELLVRSQVIHHHFYLKLVACHHTPVS